MKLLKLSRSVLRQQALYSFIYLMQFRVPGIMARQKKLLYALILYVIKQRAIGGFSITAGPPGFLIVCLEIPRDLEVHHKPDVGLVDPHTKRIGCHHDPALTFHEAFLIFSTHFF